METNPTPTPLLTLEQAAEFLGGGTKVSFLRAQIADGQLKFVKVGKRFCIRRETLLRWIQTHETRQK
jgi:excisionase family DNA binding protein